MQVKVVGPKPELCELFCHEQAHSELPNMHFVVKVEPSSLTSTPRKKAHFVRGEEICPMLTPKVQSRTTAKLTNIFADDLPNSDKKPLTMPQRKSSTVKTYNIQFTEFGAAGDYDLFTPNRQQPNNNNNNANRGRPGRGRASARGLPNRGVLGRAAPGRGVPARGGVPRGAPGLGGPQRG